MDEIINLKLSLELPIKSFYEANQISSFDNKNVIYIGYIGIIQGEPLYKFGITSDIYRRDFEEHKKNFDFFELIYLSESDNNTVIESIFKKELKCKKIYRKLLINQINQTELFTTNNLFNIQDIINILNNLVLEFKLPIIKKLESEINFLKLENKKIQGNMEELKINYKAEIQFYKDILQKIY